MDLTFKLFSVCRVFKITKWTSLTSVTVLAVDNVGVDDYENNPELFPHINQIFKHKMEMSNPTLSKGNSTVSLAYIPLTISHIYSAAQGINFVKQIIISAI